MPSRNKRNRNRAPATSGANSSKNETNAGDNVKISEDNAASKELEQTIEVNVDVEQKADVESKVEQPNPVKFEVNKDEKEPSPTRQNVNFEVKNVDKVDIESSELVKSNAEESSVDNVENKQQTDTQTAKKKRNRNRNRKKNNNSANTDESNTSSTSGTHESSPTISTQTVLLTEDVITTTITEETSSPVVTDTKQVDIKETIEIVAKKDDKNTKNRDEGHVDALATKVDSIEENLVKSGEPLTKVKQTEAIIEAAPQFDEPIDDTKPVEETPVSEAPVSEAPVESTPLNEPSANEKPADEPQAEGKTQSDDDVKLELKSEQPNNENKQQNQGTEKLAKENEKQNKSRQSKNRNKNKKEQNASVQPKKNDQIKDQTIDQSHQTVDSEDINTATTTNKVDLNTENANNDVEKLHEEQPSVIDTDAKQQLSENRINQVETKTDQSKIEETNTSELIIETHLKNEPEIPSSSIATAVEVVTSDEKQATISSVIDSAHDKNKQAEKEIATSSKINEKQKKSRQTKNGNKNHAKQFNSNVFATAAAAVDTVPMNIDENKETPNVHSRETNKIQAKNATIEMHTVDLLDINVQSNTNDSTDDHKTDSVEPISVEKIEPSDLTCDENKTVESDNISNENLDVIATIENSSKTDVSLDEKGETVEIGQAENSLQISETISEIVAESLQQDAIEQTEMNQNEPLETLKSQQIESKEEKLEEPLPAETMQPILTEDSVQPIPVAETVQSKTQTIANGTPKTSKKSKGKKQGTEHPREQRDNNNRVKDISSEESGSKSPSPCKKTPLPNTKSPLASKKSPSADKKIPSTKSPSPSTKTPSPVQKKKNEKIILSAPASKKSQPDNLQIQAPIQNQEQNVEISVEKRTENTKTGDSKGDAEKEDAEKGDAEQVADSKFLEIESKEVAPNELKEIAPNETKEITPIQETTASAETLLITSEEQKPQSSAKSLEDETKTPSTTPVLATAAAEPKKPFQFDDQSAKIWKILEEASKSLEPVEIQMDVEEDIMPIVDKAAMDVQEPIAACTSKDEQQIKEEAENLEKLLETKESNKPKPNATSKGTKPKENNQKSKQGSPSKTGPVQPQKSAEPKKKDGKSPPKHTKPNKPNQSQQTTPEKTVQKNDDEPVASDEAQDNSSLNDSEISLDVSILPNESELSELNADSKNVQGSGFVPFVESTVETKSLPFDKISVKQSDSGMKIERSMAKSKSPINVKSEKKSNSNEKINTKMNAKVPAAPKISPKDIQSLVVIEENNNQVGSNIAFESKTQTQTNAVKSDPSSTASQVKSGQNDAQKKANSPKKSPTKSEQNPKKPTIPPKPDHLIQTQAKKPQPTTSKSNRAEKILVLSGSNVDDEESEDDYIEYKFMPRQVFIATICQLCKKPMKLNERTLCQLCQMVSYCSAEHVQNDESLHKDLCAALQEIAKKRGGHIYNNARILNNNDYRSLRVHTLNLCENFMKRPLQTFEREILLFPRLCSTPTCREWRQNLLSDCGSCGQVFYCKSQPDHLVESHKNWCKSIALYQKLVVTQSIFGRIEPNLPSRIQTKPYILPNSITHVFKDLYRNFSVIRDDCVFSTVTQLATAPLTAYFAMQKSEQSIGEKLTIHLIGAELQFEADVLDIWETFFLHLAHNLMELTIVFCGPELNAENIPLDIISRIRMCRTCRQSCRIVKFDFQCAKFYHDYAKSSAYSQPDLICFFNPGFHHINSLNGFDTWTETIKIASNMDCPIVVTSYTEYESPRDLERFQRESANGERKRNVIFGPAPNVYASQRPERNFISDEIVPLIFKNFYCFILK